MPRFNPHISYRYIAQRCNIERPGGICRICGEPRGPHHDGAKCADRWVAQCDEEARKAKGGPSK